MGGKHQTILAVRQQVSGLPLDGTANFEYCRDRREEIISGQMGKSGLQAWYCNLLKLSRMRFPDLRTLEGRSIDLAQSKEKASECSPNVPERKMWEAPRCTPSTAAASNCHKPDSEKKQNKKKADPMLIQLAYAWHVLRGHINYHRLKLRQEGTPSVWVEDLEELDALDMPRCETCARGNVNPFDPDSRWVMDIENGGNWMVLD